MNSLKFFSFVANVFRVSKLIEVQISFFFLIFTFFLFLYKFQAFKLLSNNIFPKKFKKRVKSASLSLSCMLVITYSSTCTMRHSSKQNNLLNLLLLAPSTRSFLLADSFTPTKSSSSLDLSSGLVKGALNRGLTAFEATAGAVVPSSSSSLSDATSSSTCCLLSKAKAGTNRHNSHKKPQTHEIAHELRLQIHN